VRSVICIPFSSPRFFIVSHHRCARFGRAAVGTDMQREAASTVRETDRYRHRCLLCEGDGGARVRSDRRLLFSTDRLMAWIRGRVAHRTSGSQVTQEGCTVGARCVFAEAEAPCGCASSLAAFAQKNSPLHHHLELTHLAF